MPLLVGAPQLKRYTAFGHLFAAYREKYFRIDRHPVMSRHPTTPMDESDLLIHLSRQTELTSGLVDLATLQSASRSEAFDRLLAEGTDIVLVDVDSLRDAGACRQGDMARPQAGRFVRRRLVRDRICAAGRMGVERDSQTLNQTFRRRALPTGSRWSRAVVRRRPNDRSGML